MVRAPAAREPWTAPAAPPSDCISTTLTFWPKMFSLPSADHLSVTSAMTEDGVMEDALEAGAEDVITCDDSFEIRTAPSDFSSVRKYLEGKNYTFLEAEVVMIPNDKVTLDEHQEETFRKMLDAFEENDDVQDVYHNVDLPDDEEE